MVVAPVLQLKLSGSSVQIKPQEKMIMQHSVKDWMTKNLICIDSDEHAKKAKELMEQEVINHLLVFEKGELVGIISSVDLQLIDSIRSRFTESQKTEIPVFVSDIMSRDPVKIKESAPMREAIGLMKERGFRCLPVIKADGEISGIITNTDALRYAMVLSSR
jgi:acetoin utilization protein AcuB